MTPTFDKDGYPTEATLDAIAKWPCPYVGLIDFIMLAWSTDDLIWEEDGELIVNTGGWSGNESIISAMQANYVFWTMAWISSHRGGRYAFDLQRLSHLQETAKVASDAPNPA